MFNFTHVVDLHLEISVREGKMPNGLWPHPLLGSVSAIWCSALLKLLLVGL